LVGHNLELERLQTQSYARSTYPSNGIVVQANCPVGKKEQRAHAQAGDELQRKRSLNRRL
jgi:hypothetical protein